MSKPTSYNWDSLVKQSGYSTCREPLEYQKNNTSITLDQHKISNQILSDVNHARYKNKKQPYGKTNAESINYHSIFVTKQSLSKKQPPQFSRGLVRKVLSGVEIMVPAKTGSGSRGSRNWKE
tara:strand:+ start:147 stop:512 length:366 start_codon:yes stop_codon:yes gene_type:complete